MLIEADAFSSIKLSEDRATAQLVFETPDKSTVQVNLPIERLGLGIPEILRIVEAARQRRSTSATGIQEIAFSTATSIEPRADVVAKRLYLVIDQGKLNQVAYAISIAAAPQLGIAIWSRLKMKPASACGVAAIRAIASSKDL
jgi:hypothetical protein